MLVEFCLRLAAGTLIGLWWLSPQVMHPRFFRTNFLTALGLAVVAALMGWGDAGSYSRIALSAGVGLTLTGAVSWTLEPAPFGRILTAITPGLLAGAALTLPLDADQPPAAFAFRVADFLTAAAVLGSALTAMLVGHSYLISPGLDIGPLVRSTAAVFAAVAVRAVLAGVAFAHWTAAGHAYTVESEIGLWLPVRWLVGLAAPLVFGGMAFAAARIRSTQSATGILYVVVICAFLGELLEVLLLRLTGLPL